MNKVDRVLSAILQAKYFNDLPEKKQQTARLYLRKLMEHAINAESAAVRDRLRHGIQKIRDDLPPRAPPYVWNWLERSVLQPALLRWALAVVDPPPEEAGSGVFEKRVKAWSDGLPAADRARILGAAIRHEIGFKTNLDREPRHDLIAALAPSKESSMAKHTFIFDSRGLPASLKDLVAQTAWETSVESQIANLGLPKDDTNPVTSATYAAIKGMLLLDQQFDPTTAEFPNSVQQVWLETLGSTVDNAGNTVQNRAIYPAIADDMVNPGGAVDPLLYQQFASVARYIVANAQDVPFNSPLFASQVRLGMDRYVAGPPPAETLDIPALTGPEVQDAELDGQNMSVFATVYAIAQLHEMKLFYTVDRLTEDHLNGTLATQFDAGGKLLDAWFWGRRDRMTEAERMSVFSRMLGVTGGEVPKDVQPNYDFDDRFRGFLASVAEFDRQQRISDLFTGNMAGNRGSSLAMTMENVRQKGHDLGASMSLYSYGSAHFTARRLNADLTAAFNILKNSVVQKVLGVNTPYQVIERKCIADFGKAPDIVRLRTMADAGKRILDIVARNSSAWSSASGLPLFPDLTAVAAARQAVAAGGGNVFRLNLAGNNPAINAAGGPSAISVDDTEELIRQTQFWLAVNGVQYDDVDKRSQPKLNTYEPSIPPLGGTSTNGLPASGTGAAMDKIKQMISSGQTPSLDQLKALLPAGFSA